MKIDNVIMMQNIYFLVCIYVLSINKAIFHKKCNLIFGPCETILATFPVKLPLTRHSYYQQYDRILQEMFV